MGLYTVDAQCTVDAGSSNVYQQWSSSIVLVDVAGLCVIVKLWHMSRVPYMVCLCFPGTGSCG